MSRASKILIYLTEKESRQASLATLIKKSKKHHKRIKKSGEGTMDMTNKEIERLVKKHARGMPKPQEGNQQ